MHRSRTLGETVDELGGLGGGNVVLGGEEIDVGLGLRENMGEQSNCLRI